MDGEYIDLLKARDLSINQREMGMKSFIIETKKIKLVAVPRRARGSTEICLDHFQKGSSASGICFWLKAEVMNALVDWYLKEVKPNLRIEHQ